MENAASPAVPALQIEGERLSIGDWQANLTDVIAAGLELRQLLDERRITDATAMLQSRCAEEQAALVALDARPEEILSLTGMNPDGKPGYARHVVDQLPSVVVSELVAPADARMVRFNTTLLDAMSPHTLQRTVEETLDPVRYHGYRGAVSWEWLEAVASLSDLNRIARLLHAIDESVLVEALVPRVDLLAMDETITGNGVTVSAFRTLASDASSGITLPRCSDPATGDVLRALYDAAPDLIARIIRDAWETAGGSE